MPIRFIRRLGAVLAALLILAVVSSADATAAKRTIRTLDLSSHASSSGWRWAERVDIYDASLVGSDNYLKLGQAAREWSRNSAANLAVVSNSSDAEILVRTTNFDPCGIAGAVVCVYAPRVESGIASGQCQVQISDAWAQRPVGEYLALHVIGDCLGLAHSGGKSVMSTSVPIFGFLKAPTSRDYSAMASLYGK